MKLRTGHRQTGAALAFVVAGALVVTACGSVSPTPSVPGAATAAPTPSTSAAPATAPASATPSPSATPVPTPSPSPTPSPTPSPAPASATCRDGWFSLAPTDPRFVEAVEMIQVQLGVGELEVLDLRWFTGPDVVGVLEPRYEPVERWYVKAVAVDDAAWRGRFILQKRREDIKGIAGVAPYDTSGYASPDWHLFIGDGPLREVPGLPGTWRGIDFDFVIGDGNPGMPPEVEGCLAGT